MSIGGVDVTGIKKTGERKLMLFSGRAYPELADEVARHLDCQVTPTTLRDFANGEIYVRYDESIRGCDAFVIQAHTAPVNLWTMEQLIMVDALKRASAKSVTVVAPFFGYARQDKKHRGREPISARLMADLFAVAGADRLMAVDLHTDQIQGFFDGPVDHLNAMPLLADHVAGQVGTDRLTIVAPDAGRVRVAERWTDRAGCPLAIIHKRRDPDRPNEVSVHDVVGEVAGRTCVIVDDMIDTGGTVVRAAQALADRGAKEVIAAATHGVFSGDAAGRLAESSVSRLVITDTLPLPDGFGFGDLVVLPIAPLLARAVHEIFTDGSVTSLFEGQN
jgi:ribose-phosphate pyrophosphokinase